jgi:prepilin-type N-terminal cleavage/methylation domain-containing protein
MRRSDLAFTLLEVMAAVAVVAIVFTTLSRVASEGLRSEGISKRRFEASLLADEVLAGIEEQAALGILPEIGSEEYEEGIFTVAIEVSAMDLEEVFPLDDEPRRKDPSDGPAAPPMWAHTILISVEWPEGVDVRQVIRHTFAVNYAIVATGDPDATGDTASGSSAADNTREAEELRELMRSLE